jgi:hypothetical protein
MSAVQKIEYVCIKKPTLGKLDDFEVNKVYKGRTFNNLYEISVAWATHKPTFLIEKKTFDQFFKLIDQDNPLEKILQPEKGKKENVEKKQKAVASSN